MQSVEVQWSLIFSCIKCELYLSEAGVPPAYVDVQILNPPLDSGGGGGAKNAPPIANFLNNLKTWADIGAKRTVPYSASIWHPETKFKRNPLRHLWENGVLVTSCRAILGRKSANVQMLLECRI